MMLACSLRIASPIASSAGHTHKCCFAKLSPFSFEFEFDIDRAAQSSAAQLQEQACSSADAQSQPSSSIAKTRSLIACGSSSQLQQAWPWTRESHAQCSSEECSKQKPERLSTVGDSQTMLSACYELRGCEMCLRFYFLRPNTPLMSSQSALASLFSCSRVLRRRCSRSEPTPIRSCAACSAVSCE